MAPWSKDACTNDREGNAVKTVMGWIDKIVAKLARRKVDRDEGRR